MEDKNEDFFSSYGNKIQDYIDNRVLLIRLRMVKKVSNLMAQLMGVIVVALLITLIFLFISIMLGFFLGDLINNYYAGFGIVTLLFIIALIIVIKYKTPLKKKFAGSIIDIILDKTEEEDDEPTEK